MSTIAPYVLTAVLSALATAGFINLTSKPVDQGIQVLSNGQPLMVIPLVGLSRAHATVNRIVTSNSSKQPNPDLKITNPYNGSYIFSIAFRPNIQAKTDAIIESYVDNDPLLNISSGSLTDVDVLNVPIPTDGIIFHANSSLDFYVYGIGNSIAVTIFTLIGVK